MNIWIVVSIEVEFLGGHMVGRGWKILNVLFLLTFLFLSTGICLFHTEPPLGKDPFCPACKFQNSVLATAQIDFFQLPILVVFEPIRLTGETPYEAGALLLLAARGPPLV